MMRELQELAVKEQIAEAKAEAEFLRQLALRLALRHEKHRSL